MSFYFEKFIATSWERCNVARMYPQQVAVHSNGRWETRRHGLSWTQIIAIISRF